MPADKPGIGNLLRSNLSVLNKDMEPQLLMLNDVVVPKMQQIAQEWIGKDTKRRFNPRDSIENENKVTFEYFSQIYLANLVAHNGLNPFLKRSEVLDNFDFAIRRRSPSSNYQDSEGAAVFDGVPIGFKNYIAKCHEFRRYEEDKQNIPWSLLGNQQNKFSPEELD